MIKVGFTGTSNKSAITKEQLFSLIDEYFILKDNYERVELHHGVCIGADAYAHRIFFEVFNDSIDAYIKYGIVAHPPLNEYKKSTECNFFRESRDPKDYIQRNHDIVDECDILLAMPETNITDPNLIKRSGTWATVRYAIKQKVPVKLLLPNGEIHERS